MTTTTPGAHAQASGHVTATLVTTRGLGGWNPVEVYACDDCGHRSEVRVLHEAEDCGFAPEDPYEGSL